MISILETTAADAKSYQTHYYNLAAIIAVRYRVNSFRRFTASARTLTISRISTGKSNASRVRSQKNPDCMSGYD